MLHYADDESSELKNPRLNYLNRPEPVWVESRFASVNKDGTTVVLTDEVLRAAPPTPASPNPRCAPNR
jgi:lipopolysaccharide export system protein LptC